MELLTDPGAIASHLRADRSVAAALDTLQSALGDVWLVGGAVRDAIMTSDQRPRDLDVVCDRDQLMQVFGSGLLDVEVERNRHGNARFQLAGLKVDLFTPSTFFNPLETVTDVLEYFDLDVNAVGLNMSGSALLQPLHAVGQLRDGKVRINERRWSSQPSPLEQAVLRARLLKLLRRQGHLRLENPALALQRLDELFFAFPGVVEYHLEMQPEAAIRDLRRRVS